MTIFSPDPRQEWNPTYAAEVIRNRLGKKVSVDLKVELDEGVFGTLTIQKLSAGKHRLFCTLGMGRGFVAVIMDDKFALSQVNNKSKDLPPAKVTPMALLRAALNAPEARTTSHIHHPTVDTAIAALREGMVEATPPDPELTRRLLALFEQMDFVATRGEMQEKIEGNLCLVVTTSGLERAPTGDVIISAELDHPSKGQNSFVPMDISQMVVYMYDRQYPEESLRAEKYSNGLIVRDVLRGRRYGFRLWE